MVLVLRKDSSACFDHLSTIGDYSHSLAQVLRGFSEIYQVPIKLQGFDLASNAFAVTRQPFVDKCRHFGRQSTITDRNVCGCIFREDS